MDVILIRCIKTLEAGRDGDEFKRVTLLHFMHLCNVLFDCLNESNGRLSKRGSHGNH